MTSVTEKHQGLGGFEINLLHTLPLWMNARMKQGGYICITPTRFSPGYLDPSNVLSVSRYTGMIRKFSDDRHTIMGTNLLVLLGDGDDKGADLYDSSMTTATKTYAELVATRVMNLDRPQGLTLGTCTAGGTTASMDIEDGTNARTVLTNLNRLFGKEIRVNPDATLDADDASVLFNATPRLLLTEGHSGMVNANLMGVMSKIDVLTDIEDYTTSTMLRAVALDIGKASINYQGLDVVNNGTTLASTTPATTDTVELDVRMLVHVEDWTPSNDRMFAGRWDGTGNKKCWGVGITSGGAMSFWYSTDGSTTSSQTSSLLISDTIPNNGTTWLRYTVEKDGGNTKFKFFYSKSGSQWTQVGSTVTVAGTITRFTSGTTPLVAGGVTSSGTIGNGFTGRIHAMWVGKPTNNTPAATNARTWEDSSTLTVLAYPRFHDPDQFQPAFSHGADHVGNEWVLSGTTIKTGPIYVENLKYGTALFERFIDASNNVVSAHKTTVAERNLRRFDEEHIEITAEFDYYDPRFWVQPGDNVYIHKPEDNLVNLSRSIYFRGVELHPAIRRCLGITWSVSPGYGVYYIHPGGVPRLWDLTPYVAFAERPIATLEVGRVKRTLRPPRPTIETLAVGELV